MILFLPEPAGHWVSGTRSVRRDSVGSQSDMFSFGSVQCINLQMSSVLPYHVCSSPLSLQPHSLFLSTQNSTWCNTAWCLDQEIYPVPVPECLGSATVSAVVGFKKSAGWTIVGSALEISANSPLLLSHGHGSSGVPVSSTCPLLFFLIAPSLLHLD